MQTKHPVMSKVAEIVFFFHEKNSLVKSRVLFKGDNEIEEHIESVSKPETNHVASHCVNGKLEAEMTVNNEIDHRFTKPKQPLHSTLLKSAKAASLGMYDVFRNQCFVSVSLSLGLNKSEHEFSCFQYI